MADDDYVYDEVSGEWRPASEVAAEAVAMQRKLAQEKEASMIAELTSAGMMVNSDVDAAAFQEVVRPVWDNFIAENGDTLVNAIVALQK